MKRKDFLKILGLSPLAATAMNLKELNNLTSEFASTEKMPVLFVGHGSPMNALEENPFTKTLNRIGKSIQPTAILVVSAHWLTRGTSVAVTPMPETIHDFGGFPQALFDMQYPAKGSPLMAKEVTKLIPSVTEDNEWGLDHGAWTILVHMYPKANIPVFQMSIDYTKPMQYHFDLAKQLQTLRNKGVLIVGSGNIVHNLRVSMTSLMRNDPKPLDWAVEFDAWAKQKMQERDFKSLIAYENHKAGKLAAPSMDHYAPFIYTLGLAGPNEKITQEFEEVSYGGLSMRTVRVG